MESPTLAEKMAKQRFSRNKRVIAKREPIHSAVKQAKAIYNGLHGKKRSK